MRANYLWWIAGGLFAILIAGLVIYITSYQILDSKRTEGLADSVRYLEQEVEGAEVTSAHTFTGDKQVHILYASSGETSSIYYVDSEEQKIIDTMDQEKEMKKDRVRELWREKCGACTFTHLKPAYKNDQPLWEITFTDDQGRYGLAYYHAATGEQYQKFAFTKEE